jgi:hypothetical protein
VAKTRKKKKRTARSEEGKSLSIILTEAFDEKIPGKLGVRPLSHCVADHLWEQALLGRKNAYRNWQKFRAFATTFDDAPPITIQIIGGLPDPPPHSDDQTETLDEL